MATIKEETTSRSLRVDVGRARFCIPRPKSLGKFILYPSMWSLPDFKRLDLVFKRIKTNLLYFQTNYLIVSLALFALTT